MTILLLPIYRYSKGESTLHPPPSPPHTRMIIKLFSKKKEAPIALWQ